MTDTLAPSGIIGVMTPAMNTVVQPELELLRPIGVTNQMQRFRLGGDNVSDDLLDEAEKLMDCNPIALCVGLTTDAAPGGVAKLINRTQELAEKLGIPVCNASTADHAALNEIGAKNIAVVTPFNAEVDQTVKQQVEEAGFNVVAIQGTQAPSLPAICETSLDEIRAVFAAVAASECDAILQVGTALPVVSLIDELEQIHGKPIVACNAAVYWQTLRAAGISDKVKGFGRLLEQY
ncbi:MAG: hypothetical protein AAF434_19875 [Pseudomonadota bacterium]